MRRVVRRAHGEDVRHELRMEGSHAPDDEATPVVAAENKLGDTKLAGQFGKIIRGTLAAVEVDGVGRDMRAFLTACSGTISSRDRRDR